MKIIWLKILIYHLSMVQILPAGFYNMLIHMSIVDGIANLGIVELKIAY